MGTTFLREVLVAAPSGPQHDSSLRRPQDSADGRGKPAPLTRLRGEVLPARLRELVEPGLPVVPGHAPFGFDPALVFQALERGIQRAVIDEDRVFGLVLDRAGDALTVLRAEDQRPENQQIEGALEQGNAVAFVSSGRHSTRAWIDLG